MTARVLLTLGAGPGLGLATARRFAADGFTVVLVGRTADRVAPLVAGLTDAGASASGLAADVSDPDAVARVVAEAIAAHGRIDVLHVNPSAWRAKDPLELTVPELLEDVALGVGPLLSGVQAAVSAMPAGARVLVTGSMAADHPSASAASLGVQKAGLRNLVQSLDATLAPRDIRAVCVQINGALGATGPFSPEPVSQALFDAAMRPDEGWTAHVPYDG